MASESKTWILLRGLAREKAHWGDFVEKFAARWPADEILPIDLPGTGEHRDVTSPMSIDGILRHVRSEAIEKARHQGQFKVLAMSLGAMVTIEWMRQKPEDIAAAVLINTSAADLSPVYDRLRWQVWRDFLKVLAIQSARERERAVISILFNNAEAGEDALPLWTKIAMERPVGYASFFNQLLAASRSKGILKNSPVPALILNGLGDRFVDPSCSTILHESTGWPIQRHPWAGHDVAWDDPEWLLEKISTWSVVANA